MVCFIEMFALKDLKLEKSIDFAIHCKKLTTPHRIYALSRYEIRFKIWSSSILFHKI